MPFDVSAVYGITTTTLVVLSTFTFAAAQFFSNSRSEKIDQVRVSFTSRLKSIDMSEDEYGHPAVADKHDELNNFYESIKCPLEYEVRLCLVVMLSISLSILLVVVRNLFDLDIVGYEYILGGINFFAAVLYVGSLISLFIRDRVRSRKQKRYKEKTEQFLDLASTVVNKRLKKSSTSATVNSGSMSPQN